MHPDEKALREKAKEDIAAYQPLADWLEEHGDLHGAAKAREKAGLSTLTYQIYDQEEDKVIVGASGYTRKRKPTEEYRTLRAARMRVNQIANPKARQRMRIRVIEHLPRMVAELPFEENDDCARAMDERRQLLMKYSEEINRICNGQAITAQQVAQTMCEQVAELNGQQKYVLKALIEYNYRARWTPLDRRAILNVIFPERRRRPDVGPQLPPFAITDSNLPPPGPVTFEGGTPIPELADDFTGSPPPPPETLV